MANLSMAGDSEPAVGINVRDELFHGRPSARRMILVELSPFIQYHSPSKQYTDEGGPAGMELDETAA